MESKPYTIQSPEQIAKDYGGNKQKIGEAMQMGIIDPTAGTLAGMFIDRMRAAQMQEQAPQGTVAQQVMAPQPPAPPQGGPPPAPGGLGATPQAAAMPPMPPQGAPQGGPPPMEEVPADPMEEAPAAYAIGGMVDSFGGGGLSNLPVPDTMFDEPDNGGYAGGGIVAFADGGPTSGHYGDYFEALASQLVPGINVSSRQRSAARNAQVGGVKNSYHLTNDARDFTPPKGMDMASLFSTLREKFGPQYDVINEGDHVHIEPGSKKKGTPAKSDSKMPRLLDMAKQYQDAFAKNAPPETKRRDEMIAELEGGLSPEAEAKERSKDKWAALAQLGFGIASDAGPGGILGAFSRQAKEQLPAFEEEQKQDKALRRADRSALMELESKSNEEKQKIQALALEMAKAEAGLLSDERKMDLQLQIAQMDDRTRRIISAASNAMQYQVEAMRQAGETGRTGMTTAAQIAAAKERAKNGGGLFGVTDGSGQAGQTQPISVGGWDD